jgi:lipopolysaccharide/colanic/teichoic acid biosynthesis glycosyltransferase
MRPAESATHGTVSAWCIAKRAVDIVVAALMLALMTPIMALVALAIVLESRGPVFYRARRVGVGGRPLWMLKFRKMAPGTGGSPLTLREDARLTRVGAALARTRLDELPQLWHVLRGDMSLIGPRPEDPRFVATRPGDFDTILRVRPGITGLSQLAFADESRVLSVDEPISDYMGRILPQKCDLDRLYVEHPTLRMDAWIALWTVVAVLLRQPVAVHRATGTMSLRHRTVAASVGQAIVYELSTPSIQEPIPAEDVAAP